jgi:hypothetical protein
MITPSPPPFPQTAAGTCWVGRAPTARSLPRARRTRMWWCSCRRSTRPPWAAPCAWASARHSSAACPPASSPSPPCSTRGPRVRHCCQILTHGALHRVANHVLWVHEAQGVTNIELTSCLITIFSTEIMERHRHRYEVNPEKVRVSEN